MDDLFSTPKNNKPKPTSPPPLKRSRDCINEEEDIELNIPPTIKRSHRILLPEFTSTLRPPHLSILIPAYTPQMFEWSDPRSHDDPVASHDVPSSSAVSSSAASFSVSFSSVSVETPGVKQLILRLNNLKIDQVKKNQ
jgi:hypothetical protein